jgi:hypothetical protein
MTRTVAPRNPILQYTQVGRATPAAFTPRAKNSLRRTYQAKGRSSFMQAWRSLSQLPPAVTRGRGYLYQEVNIDTGNST